MDKRGRRAREGSEQRACRHIERDRKTEKIVVGTWSQRIGKVIEHELKKEVNSVHISLKATESKQERRQRQCTRTRVSERLRMRMRRAKKGMNSSA